MGSIRKFRAIAKTWCVHLSALAQAGSPEILKNKKPEQSQNVFGSLSCSVKSVALLTSGLPEKLSILLPYFYRFFNRIFEVLTKPVVNLFAIGACSRVVAFHN